MNCLYGYNCCGRTVLIPTKMEVLPAFFWLGFGMPAKGNFIKEGEKQGWKDREVMEDPLMRRLTPGSETLLEHSTLIRSTSVSI